MKKYVVYLTEIAGRERFIEEDNNWVAIYEDFTEETIVIYAENEEEAAKLAEAKANLAPYEDYLADVDNDEGLDIDDYLVPFWVDELIEENN